MTPRALMVLLGLLLGAGCANDPALGGAPSTVPVEQWRVDFGKAPWKVGFQERSRRARIIEYVPEGQTVDAWREIVTDQFIVARFPTTTRFMEANLQDLAQQVAGFQSRVISDTGTEAIYEWWHAASGRWPAEHQLTRIRQFPNGMLSLSYARKGPPMSDEEKTVWIERLKHAGLN